jgi:hypothetical protein
VSASSTTSALAFLDSYFARLDQFRESPNWAVEEKVIITNTCPAPGINAVLAISGLPPTRLRVETLGHKFQLSPHVLLIEPQKQDLPENCFCQET